jgi:ketol-acid reductoisomerase
MMIHDGEVSLDPIRSRRVAIVGYGSQGHAHALNLRDSGVDVRVALRPGGRSWATAERDGFSPMQTAQATPGPMSS